MYCYFYVSDAYFCLAVSVVACFVAVEDIAKFHNSKLTPFSITEY